MPTTFPFPPAVLHSYRSLTPRICSQEAVSPCPLLHRVWKVSGLSLGSMLACCRWNCASGESFALFHRWNWLCCCVSVKLFFQFNSEERLRQQRDSGMPVHQCMHKSKFLFRRDCICFYVFLRQGLEFEIISLLQLSKFWDFQACTTTPNS